MIAMSAEPTSPKPDPSEDEGVFLPEAILRFVIAESCRVDPRLCRTYHAKSSKDVKNAIELSQALVLLHLELALRMARGARGGRRRHHQELHRLLSESNTSTLVLAWSYLEAGYGILPGD